MFPNQARIFCTALVIR